MRVENLVVEYPIDRRRRVHAVSDVSFDIAEGETLGLVGETGCGKSTTGRAVLQLPPPTAGSVAFDGHELVGMRAKQLRALRPSMQIVLQDPISSLNPRRKVRDIVATPLRVSRHDAHETATRVEEVLDAVGLDAARVGDRRPRSFSGGQAQRICIARSLITKPRLLVCDEPVSALDVSVQAQILNLLQDMREQFGLTMLFVSHDLAVVSHISDRIAVMYLGKLCEIGDAGTIYSTPAHPYTAALLASVPDADPTRQVAEPALPAAMPSPIDPPSGCRFRTRCPRATERCAAEEPEMRLAGPGRFVACHHPLVDAAADGRGEGTTASGGLSPVGVPEAAPG